MVTELIVKSYGSNMDIFRIVDGDVSCTSIVKSDYNGLSDKEKIDSVLELFPDLSRDQEDKLYLDLQLFFNL